MRKEVPLLITSVIGLIIVFSKFFHLGHIWGLEQVLEDWIRISQGFAVAVGVLNLTRLHGRNVMRRRAEWIYSALLLLGMYFYLGLTLFTTVEGVTAVWLYDNIITPTSGALFGTIALYLTSAAYRVFRMRDREVTLMMIATVLVMLGSAPIGEAIISGWGGAVEWMLDVPVSAVYRGINIGVYIGALSVAMRVILGLERAHMGGYGGAG